MKKLPVTPFRPAAEWQRERLGRWLQEWEIDRHLPESLAEKPLPPGSERFAGVYPDRHRRAIPANRDLPPPAAPDHLLKTGQIRLLCPETALTRRRLLYLALLRAETDGQFLAAPFGRFAEPALPGELLTGRVAPSLRVLCLWNARVCPSRLLAASWVVDDLSAGELADALAVHDHQETGSDLPAQLRQRTGPPVTHPLDPRWEYHEQEQSMMVEFLAGPEAASSTPPVVRFPDTEELALAAEARPPYGMVRRWRLKGSPLVLRVSVSSDPTQYSITVVDASNQPARQLDGSVLKAPDGAQSNPINQAQVVAPAGLVRAGTILLAPDETVFTLEPLTA